MQRPESPSRRRPTEDGYILLFAIFLMALVTIALAIAMPNVIKSIQRDRDLETWHRGMQYRRAIKLYYKKFTAYPPTADALKETNNIRFLRKQYIDPVTGKVDWKPILFGQNKTPTAMGFFGQALSGGATTIAGIGPGGGNTSSAGGILPGGISQMFGGATTSTSTPTSTAPDASNGANPANASAASANAQSTTGLNGQTFGGGGIIGFEPVSPKKSIRIYKKKDHYNEWEFTYDPLSEMQSITGGNNGLNGGSGANPLNQNTGGTFGNTGGTFGNAGGSFGSNGGSFGNSGNNPPSNSSPQQ